MWSNTASGTKSEMASWFCSPSHAQLSERRGGTGGANHTFRHGKIATKKIDHPSGSHLHKAGLWREREGGLGGARGPGQNHANNTPAKKTQSAG